MVGSVALVLYLPRTAVGVQPGDGAEFALAAATGSLVHPPGFPVYTAITALCAKLWAGNPYATLAAGERMGTQCAHPAMQALASPQGNKLV